MGVIRGNCKNNGVVVETRTALSNWNYEENSSSVTLFFSICECQCLCLGVFLITLLKV